jgi:hypothetical protein
MGLDFHWGPQRSANIAGPRWSYSGFMVFRERLARAAGLIGSRESLNDHYGSVESVAFRAGDRQALHAYPSQFNEPLVLLIDHADCEGDLSPDQCRRLAPRLRELMKDWPADDYDRIHGERLAAACEECARTKTILEFC